MNWLNKLYFININGLPCSFEKIKQQKNKETLYEDIIQNYEKGAECYHLYKKEQIRKHTEFVYICITCLWKDTQKPVTVVAYLGKAMGGWVSKAGKTLCHLISFIPFPLWTV